MLPGALGASWRSTRSAAQQRSGEPSGAVIILALVFLVAVSLIVTALLTWTGASLHATTNFQDERNVEYAATHAVNLAIQNTRYSFDYGTSTSNPYSPSGPMLNNATPQLCATYLVPGQTNSVDVYCTLVWQPYSANTRVFTYSACSTAGSNDAKPVDCAAQPLLQAVVAFDDYPSRGRVALADPEPMHADPATGEPPQRAGQWFLWREHDTAQLAVEPCGARHHIPLPVGRRHQRGNDRDDPGDGVHQR